MLVENPILSPEECREVYHRVEQAGRSMGISDLEIVVGGSIESLTRFANNEIHQNVVEQSRALSVRVVLDHKTARATTNRFDPDSVRRVLEEALSLTKSVEPNPDLLPLYAPESLPSVERFDPATASVTPGQRAQTVAEAIRVVESAGQTAAGIYSTDQGVGAILNSKGVEAYYSETMARFSITAMAQDSSGWAKASAVRLEHLDPLSLTRSAAWKARRSASPREVPPGPYTVVLEPAAVLDLVGQMFGDFSGTALADQRSFLNNRMGEPLFGENITIHDDVYHPLQAGSAYDGEGVPRRRLTLVEAGVPRELAYSRALAAKAGAVPTGHGFPLPNEIGEAPMNIVIAGGSTPVDQMIAGIERGILVTRFWYIREVDPYEKIMTGMTRDGTFLIEGGQVVCGLRNFRFNQSLIELLKNVERMSPPVRASGEETFEMVVPAMQVRDFHFTEVTRF